MGAPPTLSVRLNLTSIGKQFNARAQEISRKDAKNAKLRMVLSLAFLASLREIPFYAVASAATGVGVS